MELTIPKPYTPQDWYWIVAGSTTQVYSSAAVAYVAVSNPTYQTWLASGNSPTKIAVEQDLFDVLAGSGAALPAGGITSDVLKSSRFDGVPQAVRSWAFDIENRFRVSQGQATLTPSQFKTYVKSLPGM